MGCYQDSHHHDIFFPFGKRFLGVVAPQHQQHVCWTKEVKSPFWQLTLHGGAQFALAFFNPNTFDFSHIVFISTLIGTIHVCGVCCNHGQIASARVVGDTDVVIMIVNI